jgi:uncharacterized surface protein with fasciclin (FAS1) repeats
MRAVVALPILASGVFAQQQNATYLAGLVQALSSAGLTSLASAAAAINGTDVGKRLLTALPNAGPLTVFAPNNDAFAAIPSSVTGNANLVANIIAYHVLPGNYTNATATAPNVTVAHTLLNDTTLVNLEGNKSQVLVFNKDTSDVVHIQNQATDVTVSTVVPYENIEVKVIPAVLIPPGNISTVIASNTQLSAVGSLAASVPGVVETLTTAHGYTFFAPSTDALTAAAPALAGLQGNNTALTTVIGNHIINGTSVYSSDITDKSTYTSAAGQKISFVFNSTGLFVVSGDNVASAQIIRTNVLTDRGVIHIIGGVLANTASNSGAASSAFQSATSAAAKPSQTNPGSGAQSSGSSSPSNAANGRVSLIGKGGLVGSVICVLGALMGGFLVL